MFMAQGSALLLWAGWRNRPKKGRLTCRSGRKSPENETLVLARRAEKHADHANEYADEANRLAWIANRNAWIATVIAVMAMIVSAIK